MKGIDGCGLLWKSIKPRIDVTFPPADGSCSKGNLAGKIAPEIMRQMELRESPVSSMTAGNRRILGRHTRVLPSQLV
jgi:hypothetical protein